MAENQLRRIEVLERQMSKVLAEQTAFLRRQVQMEARFESKLESEMLRDQLMTSLKEQLSGSLGKILKEPPNGALDFDLKNDLSENLGFYSNHGKLVESSYMCEVTLNCSCCDECVDIIMNGVPEDKHDASGEKFVMALDNPILDTVVEDVNGEKSRSFINVKEVELGKEEFLDSVDVLGVDSDEKEVGRIVRAADESVEVVGEKFDALVSVSCPNDLENMMDEHKKLVERSPERSAKLRIVLLSPLELDSSGLAYLGYMQNCGQKYVEAVNGTMMQKVSVMTRMSIHQSSFAMISRSLAAAN